MTPMAHNRRHGAPSEACYWAADVRFWHKADITALLIDVRFWG
jgi:hypothetical protein